RTHPHLFPAPARHLPTAALHTFLHPLRVHLHALATPDGVDEPDQRARGPFTRPWPLQHLLESRHPRRVRGGRLARRAPRDDRSLSSLSDSGNRHAALCPPAPPASHHPAGILTVPE